MDSTLIRTFLEVANTGSFVSAADRLFVTQSAVSLRIQRLEDTLGKPLFTRSRAGAELTPAGNEFAFYAQSMLRIWEEARQKVAIPDGFTASLAIGAQYSLWPRLGFRWLDRLQAAHAQLSIRTELGMSDRLTRMLVEGVVEIALQYTPQMRPGLDAELVMEEELILVTSFPCHSLEELAPHYVLVDWGPEFLGAHGIELHALSQTGKIFGLGALTADYLSNRKAGAYLPARSVKREIEAGRLHLMPNAPRFPYPIWAVWRSGMDADLLALARSTLADAAASAREDGASVVTRLETLSERAVVDGPGKTLSTDT